MSRKPASIPQRPESRPASGLLLRWPPDTTVRPSSDPVRTRPRRPAARTRRSPEHPPTAAHGRRPTRRPLDARPAHSSHRCPHATESRIRRPAPSSTRRTACNPQSPAATTVTFTPAGSTSRNRHSTSYSSAADSPSASRTPPSSTAGRAPMASHHRQHDRVLPVGGKTRPIQRNDHLRAGADDERRPVCEKGPDVDASIAQEPIHLFTPCLVNVPMAWAKPRPTAWIASEALVSTPGGVGQRQPACRSPSYKAVMKFRRSCLRSHCG